MDRAALREAVADAARRLNLLGINQGTSGNVSARAGKDVLITPTGVAYDAITAADIVAMDLDGGHEGPLAPSSEWRIHRDILAARPDAGAVVHAHPPFCTALAAHRRGIPPFHYMVAKAGGSRIDCAAYATYGTQALSDNVMAALGGRRACLMANHGMVALGADPPAALALAVEVEALAAQYLRALHLGEPALLSEEEMLRVLEKFETYGRQPGAEPGQDPEA